MAKLTLEDLLLVDEQNKVQEYDYSTTVQEEIHRVVTNDIQLGISKNVAPRVGKLRTTYLNQTVEYTFTTDDVEAYCAYRPYVCATTETEREGILNQLRKSGTVSTPNPSYAIRIYKSIRHAKDGIVVQYGPFGANSEDNRDIEVENISVKNAGKTNPISLDPSPLGDPDFLAVFKIEQGGIETKDYYIAREIEVVVRTPVQPEPSTSSSHKVKTRTGSRLAFRTKSSSVRVSEVANQDINKKGKLIQMIPNGESYVLLKEGLGYSCQWDYILYKGKKGYVYNLFTEPLKSDAHLKYICKEEINSGELPFLIDWTREEINKPFYESVSAKWCVPVETEHDSTGGTELKNRMLGAREKGLETILKENGKNYNKSYMDDILKKHISAYAEDYYIDPRPGAKMRVLVTFQQKYIPSLDDVSLKPCRACDTCDNIRLIILEYPSYLQYIEKTSLVLESYAKDIDNFDGTVENADLKKESARLKQTEQKITELIRLNEIDTSTLTQIEIYINEDGVCCFVRENSSGMMMETRKGTVSFLDSDPIDSPRTMNYLYFLREIPEMKKGGLDWIEFLDTYTIAPRPKVFPSKSKEESKLDTSDGKDESDKLDKELKDEYGSVKTDDQQDKEKQKAYGNKKRKNKILKQADKDSKFVGDDRLSNLPKTARELSTLDDVYKIVLNKISLGELKNGLMECFENPVITAQFADAGSISVKINPSGTPKTPTVKFGDILPTRHILASMSYKIWDAIISAMTATFVDLVKELVADLFDICDTSSASRRGDRSNINDLIELSFNTKASAQTGDNADKNADNVKLEVLDAVGSLTSTLSSLTPQEKENILNDLKKVLSELSLLLTSKELCRLFKGIASDNTIALVRSLIKRTSSSISSGLDTKTKIIDFFILIGRLAGSEMCDELAESPSRDRRPIIDCKDPFAPSGDLSGQLGDKKDGTTNDQINEQLAKARKRQKAKLRKLAAISDIISAHENDEESPFDKLIPDLFCNDEEESRVSEDNSDILQRPLFDTSHEADDFLRGVMLNTLFSGANAAFNEDILLLPDVYTREETVEVDENVFITISSKAPTGATFTITNPHLKALEGQGVDVEKIVKNANPTDTFKRKIQVRKPSDSARNLLMKLESSNFEAKNDTEGIYYEIILPPNREVVDNLQEILDNLGTPVPKEAQEGLTALKDKLVNWKIRYKIPYQTDATKGSIDDDYIIEIFVDAGPGEQQDLLRIVGKDEIDAGVRNFIKVFTGGDTALIKQPVSIPTSSFTIGNMSDWNEQLSTASLTYNPYEKSCASCLPTKGTAARSIVDGIKKDPTNLTLIEDIKAIKSKTQKCDAVLSIKYLYDEDKATYNHIWAGIKSLYEEECGKKITAYLPPPQAVFGKYVGHLWKTALSQNNMNSSDSKELKSFIEQIEARYGKDAHSQISRDLITATNRQILNSPLFGSTKSVMGNETIETPLLSNLELENRPLTKPEIACGINNHMLKIECYKEESKNNISNNSCPAKDISNMKTDGSPAEEMSTIELSIMEPIIKMTIRGYLIDYAVRGIFPLSTFKQENKIDSLIVSFFLKKILAEMAEYSEDYVKEFAKFALGIYQNMADKREIAIEMYDPGITSNKEYIGLQGLIRSMIPLVYSDLQKIIRRDTGHAALDTAKNYLVNSYNNKENSWIRRVDFMTEQNQTTRLDIATNTPEPKTENYFLGTEDFALQNLSFYKKRAKAKWKDTVALLIVDKYLEAANGNNEDEGLKDPAYIEALQHTGFSMGGAPVTSSDKVNYSRKGAIETFNPQEFKNNADKLKNSLANISFSNSEIAELELSGISKGPYPIGKFQAITALAEVKILTQNYVQEDINKIQEILNIPAPTYHEVNFSNNNLFIEEFWKIKRKTDDEIKTALKEAAVGDTERSASVKAFNDFWKKEYPDRNESIYVGYKEIDTYFSKFLDSFFKKVSQSNIYSLEMFFEEVSPNMRIIYSNNLDYNTTALINKYVKGNPTLNARLNSLKKHKGAYSEKKIEDLRRGRDFIRVKSERFPLPLVDPTRDDDYNPLWWRNSAHTSFTDIKNIKNYWTNNFNTQVTLKRDLKNSREFKLMFDYLFPVDRHLSFLNVYSFMAVSTMEGVEKSFVATKDELYRMFRILSTGGGSFKGGYKNQTLIKNEHALKIGQKLSGLSGSTPCPAFSFSGGFKPFKGLGIDTTLKLHAKAPMVIFKLMAESLDPNIKAMIKILQLVRMLGVCLPPPLISLGLLPPTIFGIPPLGIGVGPILTPMGFAYHALGFEQNPSDLYKLFGVEKDPAPSSAQQPESDVVDADCSNISNCGNQDKENEE